MRADSRVKDHPYRTALPAVDVAARDVRSPIEHTVLGLEIFLWFWCGGRILYYGIAEPRPVGAEVLLAFVMFASLSVMLVRWGRACRQRAYPFGGAS
jgi:hypothetical protein